MDSTKKEELLKRRCESHQKQKSSTWNKENEVPAEDSEWLRRNDNYQMQSINVPFLGQEIMPARKMATHSCLR
jgi:hypothetical protein